MRILIIALPRTGSTSLMNILSKKYGLKSFFEPFDNTNRVVYNGEDNSVVKTIICHHSNNLELIKRFDKIILLNRRNIKELVESHSYQTYFSKTIGYNSNHPYLYKSPPADIVKLCEVDIRRWDSEMESLSKYLNIPITYYEDIFDENSKDRLRINDELKITI